eukprot:1733743-Rhodomonas_salina.6
MNYLRACYAMSGTDLGNVATSSTRSSGRCRWKICARSNRCEIKCKRPRFQYSVYEKCGLSGPSPSRWFCGFVSGLRPRHQTQTHGLRDLTPFCQRDTGTFCGRGTDMGIPRPKQYHTAAAISGPHMILPTRH